MGSLIARGSVTVNGWDPLKCMLEIDIERVDVATISDVYGVDPRWIHIDRNGHYHGYTKKGDTPTLTVVTVEQDDHACDEECDEDGCFGAPRPQRHMACRICGVKVTPGKKVIQRGGEPHYVESRRTAVIKVPFAPVGHGLVKHVMRDPYRPVDTGRDAEMLSVYVDLGEVTTPTKPRRTAFFGMAVYGNVESGMVPDMWAIELNCVFLEEVSHG